MSSQEKKREQAMRLLHGMTEIDDRFLIEALGEEAGQPTGQEHAADEKQGGLFTAETGRKKPHGRNYYRYSRWALTVAACLAVVIIGRYVGVSSVKNSSAQRMDNAQVQENTGGQEKDEAVPKDVVVPEKDEAVPKDVVAPEKDSAEQKDIVPSIYDAEEEAAEAPAYDAEEEAAEASAYDAAQEAAGEAEDAFFNAEDSTAMNAAATGAAAMNDTAAAGSAAMPNPFIETKTLEEAQKAAGFSITLPKLDTNYDSLVYRAMEGRMIEVIYLDEYGRECCRIRKGLNMEDDISGIYYEYAETKELKTDDGIRVTVYGENAKGDRWETAVWTKDADAKTHYSYSIYNGKSTFTTDEILRIVQVMSK